MVSSAVQFVKLSYKSVRQNRSIIIVEHTAIFELMVHNVQQQKKEGMATKAAILADTKITKKKQDCENKKSYVNRTMTASKHR